MLLILVLHGDDHQLLSQIKGFGWGFKSGSAQYPATRGHTPEKSFILNGHDRHVFIKNMLFAVLGKNLPPDFFKPREKIDQLIVPKGREIYRVMPLIGY